MQDAAAWQLFGTTQASAERRRFSAGALECEVCEGAMQAVRWHGVEVIRGISYLLRDRNWGTVPASVSHIDVIEASHAFTLRFRLTLRAPEGTLQADARVQGDAAGHLTFEVVAAPDAALQTNRCGFVVLHPAAMSGRSLQVEHTDGRESRTEFPREISPAQPVLDIRALRFSPAEGVEAICRLDAELPGDPAGRFEMEDQRNWSDASFKTYVGSLLDPWPYELPAATALRQRVTLTMLGAPEVSPAGDDACAVTVDAPGALRMPAIGVGVPPGLRNARPEEQAALRDLGADWWIVEAALEDAELGLDLTHAARLCTGLPVRIQLDVIVPSGCSPVAAAARIAGICTVSKLAVHAWRMLPQAYLESRQPTDAWPDLPPLEAYAAAARAQFPGAEIGGGMFTSFTELNRKRPSASGLDFIGHLTCPIVHAPDDRSVMQTMEALPQIAHSVRSLWPTLAYRLGPSTIAMRRNPYGEALQPNPRHERLALAGADPRHDANFGAAWTVAYAAAVAPLGLEVLSLHESHGVRGPLGITADAIDARLRRRVPAWRVLRILAHAARYPIVALHDLTPGVVALAWSVDGETMNGLLANITARPTRVRWNQPVRIDDRAPQTDAFLAPFQVCEIAASLLQRC